MDGRTAKAKKDERKKMKKEEALYLSLRRRAHNARVCQNLTITKI